MGDQQDTMNTRAPGLLAAAVCLMAAGAAHAASAADTSPIITFQIENDSTRPHSDQYYTSGLRLGYTSAPNQLPDFLADFGHAVLGGGSQRMALDLSQLILTPRNTQSSNPPQSDRPFAGLLMASLSLIQDTADSRTALGLGLGVIGPAALGEQVQNGFLSLVGQDDVRGWSTQIPNQPVLQLTADRIWRIDGPRLGALETDALPSLTAGVGSFRIYGQAGAQLRIGQGLHADFGAPRIRPGMSGTDAYDGTGFAWYVFVGADGQAVGWDETLDGLPFAGSRHVGRSPFVGELEGGIAVMAWGFRVTASQVLQTTEFRGQRAGLFQFSSLAISAKF